MLFEVLTCAAAATFWQGLILTGLDSVKALKSLDMHWSGDTGGGSSCSYSEEEAKTVVVDTLQSILICIEMLAFALLHVFSFPSREFRDASLPVPSVGTRIRRLFDVADVYEDATRHLPNTGAGSVLSATGKVADAVSSGLGRMVARGRPRGRGAAGGLWLEEPLLEGDEEGELGFESRGVEEGDKIEGETETRDQPGAGGFLL